MEDCCLSLMAEAIDLHDWVLLEALARETLDPLKPKCTNATSSPPPKSPADKDAEVEVAKKDAEVEAAARKALLLALYHQRKFKELMSFFGGGKDGGKKPSSEEITIAAFAWRDVGDSEEVIRLTSAAQLGAKYDGVDAKVTPWAEPQTAAISLPEDEKQDVSGERVQEVAIWQLLQAQQCHGRGMQKEAMRLLEAGAASAAERVSVQCGSGKADDDGLDDPDAHRLMAFLGELVQKHVGKDRDVLTSLVGIIKRAPVGIRWLFHVAAAHLSAVEVEMCIHKHRDILLSKTYTLSSSAADAALEQYPWSFEPIYGATSGFKPLVLVPPSMTESVLLLDGAASRNLALHDFKGALDIANRIFISAPSVAPLSTLVTLVRAAMHRGALADVMAVVAHFETISTTGPPDARLKAKSLHNWASGCANMMAKNGGDARNFFKAALQICPGSPLLHMFYGHGFSIENFSHQAIRAYQDGIARSEALLRGCLRIQGGRKSHCCLPLRMTNADQAELRLYLGRELRIIGWHQRAEETFRIAEENDPSSPHIANELATCLLALGRKKEAIEFFKRAVLLAEGSLRQIGRKDEDKDGEGHDIWDDAQVFRQNLERVTKKMEE